MPATPHEPLADTLGQDDGEPYDLLVTGGTLVTPAGPVHADVGVRGGKIVGLGALGSATAARTIDASGLTVLPGVVDTQVHFREPGLEHKEDLATGTASAALGGVTAVFEMPNTKPSTTTAEALQAKLDRAAGRAWVDHAFFAGAAAENVDMLAELERYPGCCGVKIFMGSSTGSLLVDDPDVLEHVLRKGTRRVAIHCEDEARLVQRKAEVFEGDGPFGPELHPVWRDDLTAYLATEHLLKTARRAGRRVHVLHVTTAEEMALLARHKDIATVEVTPQHLTLAAEDAYPRLGTRAQMNPPIRGRRHREALWNAVALGIVDVVGSDHAPHTLEEKSRDYPATPSGMPGVQTLLPLLLNHVNEGRLTLTRLVDLVCHGPQRLYDMSAKGRLALGYDADLTLVDMAREETITDAQMASRVGWTPFDGMKVKGWPVGTVVRGHVVMRDGQLLGAPIGAPVRFLDTLPKA